ncbi:Cytosolic sulfotransferase 15 [Sesamum alatum]|uniref:Sulfotransferase n=1 Tax=Sesamum alatum TaxID=300844 RepID=A0AAE1Y314_9LAMI|nr:Cytosolic sulfotransferase 15 [Sesamum alatum]
MLVAFPLNKNVPLKFFLDSICEAECETVHIQNLPISSSHTSIPPFLEHVIPPLQWRGKKTRNALLQKLTIVQRTTWLKALTFSIANRHLFTIDQSPLLTSSPHTLVPFLEFNVYWEQENPDLDNIPSPRIFATHMPFNIFHDSIRENDCKIIYICRNPLDQFVSHIHFSSRNKSGKDADSVSIDDAFDMYCQGINSFRPVWDHILGYWNTHLENPGKVLFLKYEDLKEDITSQVKKIAEFMGFPFSLEEEEQGLIDHITGLCSSESLSNLAVNKTGNINGLVKNSSFFRKGQVGDWTNYLTPPMVERIKMLKDSKFGNSSLMVKT